MNIRAHYPARRSRGRVRDLLGGGGGSDRGPGGVRLQILSHIAASAGAVEYTFERLSAEHGLSQMSVHDLAQDADGEVWVATQAGLDLYDGATFRSYGLGDGLASDDVRDIELAPDGEVWLGLNGYLARGGAHGFTSFRAPDGAEVLSVAVGAAGDVWCGTSRGLLRWDGQRFEEIVPDVAISRVTRAADGIWLASVRGVGRLEDGRAASWIPGTEGALDVALDRAGRVWSVGNFGLVVLRDGAVVERRPDLPGFRVHQDRAGDMWVGGVEQIARIHGDTVTRFDRTQGFPLDAAEAILEDAEGLLWFGGFGGIAKFVGRPFVTYGTDDGLPSANVRPIVRARDGALWVGTHSGAARQGPDGRFVPIAAVDGQIVMSLAEDPDGAVWIGTAEGLYVARRASVEQRLWVDVEKLVFTPDRALWAVSSTAGLLRAPPGGDFEPVVVPGNDRGARTRLLVTQDGALWFGGARGLSRFDGARWETFTTADGLASDEVYHLAEDSRGHLWFGYSSSRGLTRFDGWRFRTWTTADGLSSDAVYSIGVDGDGAVWVGTARGVDRFDGERFRNYGPPEGYASYESNAHGFWADPDGTLWFGTLGGLSRYDPSQDLPLDRPPRIELAEVLLGGEPPRHGLDWRHGELTAEIHVHSSAPTSRTELRYRLVGLGGDWRPLDGHSLRVARLPAGAYRLEVQARRYGGPWSEPATAAFSILAPWWRQPAFAVFAAGLGALGLWGAVRLRLRGMMRRQAVLERHMAEVEAAEARAQAATRAKSAFLANMSHELRTPLNAIIGYAELVGEDLTEPTQREDLDRIRGSAQHLLRIISDILDLTKVEAGQLEVTRGPVEVEAVARSALSFAQPWLRGRDLSLSSEVEAGLWVVADEGRLVQVLVNLLSNACRFTDRGSVVLRAAARDGQIVFAVVDTGIGIPASDMEHIFQPFVQVDGSSTRRRDGAGLGLTITRELVEQMGGTIRVESAVGVGSTFEVALPRASALSRAA